MTCDTCDLASYKIMSSVYLLLYSYLISNNINSNTDQGMLFLKARARRLLIRQPKSTRPLREHSLHAAILNMTPSLSLSFVGSLQIHFTTKNEKKPVVNAHRRVGERKSSWVLHFILIKGVTQTFSRRLTCSAGGHQLCHLNDSSLQESIFNHAFFL